MSARTAATWLCLPLMAASFVTGCERMCGSSNPEWDPQFSAVTKGSTGTGGMAGRRGVAGMGGMDGIAGVGGMDGIAGMGGMGGIAGVGGREPLAGDGGAGAPGMAGVPGGMGDAGGGAGASAAGGGGGSMIGMRVPIQPVPVDCIDSWTRYATVRLALPLDDLVYDPVDNRFWFSTREGVSAVEPDTGNAVTRTMGTWQGLAAHPAGGVWAVNGTQLQRVMLVNSEPPLTLSETAERPVLVTDDTGELVWWIDGTRKEFSLFNTKSKLLMTGPRFLGSSGLVDLVLSSDDWLWYLGQENSVNVNRTVLGRVKARSFDAMSRNVEEEVRFDTTLATHSVPTALVSMEPARVADSVLATLAADPHVFVRATTPKTDGTPVTIGAEPRKLTGYRNCGAILTHGNPNGLKRLTFDGSVKDIKVDAPVELEPRYVAIGIQDKAQVLAVEDSINDSLLLFKPAM